MRTFFDYMFVTTYIIIDKLNNSFAQIIPVPKMTLHSTIRGISFVQTMNIFMLHGLASIIFKYNIFLTKIDGILWALLALAIYELNCHYFEKSRRYKRILRKIKPNKRWYIISFCYDIFSTFLAFFTVLGNMHIMGNELL